LANMSMRTSVDEDGRSVYRFRMTLNERRYRKVVIDSHFKGKHGESVTEEIILEVLKRIDGEVFDPVFKDVEFEYFKVEPIFFDDAPYRLIFLLFVNEYTLGVINCFRVQRRKHE